MKEILFRILIVAVILSIISVCVTWAVTETHSNMGAIMEEQPNRAFKKVSVYQVGTPPSDFTETINPIFGQLMSITIDAVGTDTDFDVIVNDENGLVVFSHTTLTTANVPYRYAIVESDNVDGTEFRGANVGGECTIEMANGDDSSLTSITVTLYYEQNWQ